MIQELWAAHPHSTYTMELPNEIAIRMIEFTPASQPSSVADSSETHQAALKIVYWDGNGIIIRDRQASAAEEAIRMLLEKLQS